MALTENQILSISEILEITPQRVTEQISYLGSRLTAAVETRIAEKITAWDAVADKFVRFKAKESNQGFETDPADQRHAIRSSVAAWLDLQDVVGGDEYFTVERG